MLRRSDALDFDGLLIEARALFETSETARERWRSRVRELLVDEAQDVAAIEWDVLGALVDKDGGARLFAVGDPDQAIYEWRDGPSGLGRLGERFDGLEVLTLDANRRSSANIVEAADALMAGALDRVERSTAPTRESGPPIFSIAAQDPEHEARVVVRVVANALSDGVRADEIAVLARTHAELQPVEAALARARIAYEVLGGVPFHERAEIQDVLAYLRLVVNPHDEDAFWRAAGAPKRGIGPVSRGRLTGFVREANEGVRFGDRTSLVDAVSSERVRALFQGRTRKGLEEFSALLAELGAERADEALPLVESVLARLRPSGWLDELDSRVDGGRREEALEALVQLARDHDEQHEGSGAAGFVARLTLDGGPNEAASESRTDDPRESSTAAVRLSTLHGAKGAEFDVVAIVGVAEGSIPHGRTLSERPETGLDEERRLLFVGLTRARDQVFLTWPKRRRFGGEGWAPARASRFFSDLPTDLVGRVPPELVDSLATQGGPETLGLSVGDRVEHLHFGEGEVVLFTSRDADARAIVVFEGFGPRELFLRHTTLRRVPR